MTCDDFLPALETGGLFRRTAARWHAARCPACARVLARWQALKSELAEASPLTDRQRDLWLLAAEPAPVRPRLQLMWRLAALALVTALPAGFVLWSTQTGIFRTTGRVVQKRESDTRVAVVPISPESIARELSPLERGLDRVEAELAMLARRAARVDAHRQTATLLEEYRHW
jgi:hypothetical protein